MTSCSAAQPAPLRCPTLVESIAATVALLPSGAAWPVNDGGGTIGRFLSWLTGAGIYAAASGTLVTAGLGVFTFGVPPGLSYVAGDRARATSVGFGDWMEGFVAAYSGGAITLDVDAFESSGYVVRGGPGAVYPHGRSDWQIALVGAPTRAPAARTSWPVGYVQAGFFSAIGALRNYVEQRLCALRLEFWCATESETNDLWMHEYGLPDPCDPFPDLCTKVRAIGGATCDYFNEIIARLGWRAECFELSQRCGAEAGCSQAGARGSMAGDQSYLGLIIKVHTGEPIVLPSVEVNYKPPLAGRFLAGQRPSCDTIIHPSITPVRCLMDRIAPAHVQIQYIT